MLLCKPWNGAPHLALGVLHELNEVILHVEDMVLAQPVGQSLLAMMAGGVV